MGIDYKPYREHKVISTDLDNWPIVHRSITLVNFQLDAQNSLFIYIQYIYGARGGAVG